MVAARVHLRLSAFRASLDKANTLGLADIDQLLGKAFTCVYCNQVSISVKLSRKAGDKERENSKSHLSSFSEYSASGQPAAVSLPTQSDW